MSPVTDGITRKEKSARRASGAVTTGRPAIVPAIDVESMASPVRLAWTELHQDELLENSRRARGGETLQAIEPLR